MAPGDDMKTSMDAAREWNAFVAFLHETYWPCLPPDARIVSRPAGPETPGEEAGLVPDDLWQAVVIIFPDAEAWLHNPIPNLGGHTPLHALREGRGAELRAILVDVAPFILPDPEEVTRWDGA